MRIVFTGGPCTGKSTTFDAFKEMTSDTGYCEYVPELARVWLKHFEKYEPEKHPSVNREFFQNFLETLHKSNWVGAKENGIVDTIYDRGLPDEIAYRIFFGMEDNSGLYIDCQDTFTYDKVFFFPFWDEIYQIDEVRTESLRDAAAIEFNLRRAYENCGYEVIEVPFGTIEERVNFIKEKIYAE